MLFRSESSTVYEPAPTAIDAETPPTKLAEMSVAFPALNAVD